MHESLQWKHESDDSENDDNIGLELKESVEPGTVLLKVPFKVVFDAHRIRTELEEKDPVKVQVALAKLEESGMSQHVEGFFIFLQVWKSCKEGDASPWSPYIQSLPRNFVQFSETEKSCLPFYAKYIADFQEQKLKAFCHAAVESGLVEATTSSDDEDARFAFCAVCSRFWKTTSTEEGTAALMKGTATENPDTPSTSELVPVGDMFNHKEPPNVGIAHDGEYVCFYYKGSQDGNVDCKDLFITYGQPSNAHRFMGIFGFVPSAEDMPNVWSHVVYQNNPYSDDVEKMTFRTSDGDVPKQVWDAVLYELLEPKHPPNEPPIFSDMHHTKYKTYTADILKGQIDRQLEELAALRQRIQMIEALGTSNSNIGLIRYHNEFLTDVFEKASKNVAGELEASEAAKKARTK